eukprot:CAMPEP_0113614256 /NCGR_PEP_ID=MMETSP0017_2-20120614/7069_1 /TAXON_ID=2856 /ORGANISM="Cylindrotheca closterium" /LENGTH=954 /DNA_ID=CAMNT_0000523411 /DNA_START=522 /DNA_END=3386 /DNA_ORIENTATION=+ /assembly_acc=CAM_ASM_000147
MEATKKLASSSSSGSLKADSQHRSRSPKRDGSHKKLASSSSSGMSLNADSQHRSRNRSSSRRDEDRDSKRRHRSSKPASTPGAVSSRGSDRKKSSGSRSGSSRDPRPGARSGSASEDRSRRKNDRQSGGGVSDKSQHRTLNASSGHRSSGDRKERSGPRAAKPGAVSDNTTSRHSSDARKKERRSNRASNPGAVPEDATRSHERRKEERVSKGAGSSPFEEERIIQGNGSPDGETMVEATTVEDIEEGESKKRLEEEAERQRIRMEQENEVRLREQMEDIARQAEEDKRKKKRRMICVGVAILFLAAVGVGAFFAFQQSKDETPSSPPPESSSPSLVSSAIPSDAPSDLSTMPGPDSAYSPPDVDDCLKIANGLSRDGQDELVETQMIDVTMNVELVNDETDGNIWAPVLEEKIQQLLIPDLAGCSPTDPGSNTIDGNRQLLQNGRYAIYNGKVKVNMNAGTACEEGKSEPCYIYTVVATVNLTLQGKETFRTLSGLISEVFNAGNLMQRLGLEAPFQSVGVILVGSTTDVTTAPTGVPATSKPVDPTNAPSVSQALSTPTTSPSNKPTNAPVVGPSPPPTPLPTWTPSVSPTNAPVVGPSPPPTLSPTRTPSVSPSNAPVVGPSPPPTLSPTRTASVSPTNAPVVGPSPPPTLSPTRTASVSPTNAPVVGPSPPPTPSPSKVASLSPSASPSRMPSELPSESPSVTPTPGPTTPIPTRSPTKAPTKNPTAEPSISLAPTDRPTFAFDGTGVTVYGDWDNQIISGVDTGRYFLFVPSDWEAFFGSLPTTGNYYNVEQRRNGAVIWQGQIYIWNYAGSRPEIGIPDGFEQGRRHPGDVSAPGQWQTGDMIVPRQGVPVNGDWDNQLIAGVDTGKYFLFVPSDWEAVFGSSPTTGIYNVVQLRNSEVIWQGQIYIWIYAGSRPELGVPDGFESGRRHPGDVSAPGQWQTGDMIVPQ